MALLRRSGIIGPKSIDWKMTFALLLVAYICNGMANDRLRISMPPPSIDAILDIVPYYPDASKIANSIGIVIAISIIVIISDFPSIEFFNVAKIFIPFFMFRAISAAVTTHPVPFPDANIRCLPMASSVFIQIERSLGVAFELIVGGDSKVLCGDTMFSGHTGIMIIGSWFIFTHINQNWKEMTKIVLCVATFIGMLALLVARMHYSVDQLIGALASMFFIGYFPPVAIYQKD